MTSFYPDFLRNRVTPALHDVVAEEVDNELLVRARDTDGMGRELSGWAAEIRYEYGSRVVRMDLVPRKRRGHV